MAELTRNPHTDPQGKQVPRTWVMRAPDDFHCHFRDFSEDAWNQRNGGELGEHFAGDTFNRLPLVLGVTARQFKRAIAMPNTSPHPIVNAAMAMAYKRRIMVQAEQDGYPDFEPLMTIYGTHDTTPSVAEEAKAAGVLAVKFYPKHGTTGSGQGIHDFIAPELLELYKAMQACGLVAQFHLASPDPHVDIFDREAVMVPTFQRIREAFPNLKMIFEHISTAAGVNCVLACGENTFATVTPQHLLATRNDLLDKLRPSLYCMPPLQRREDLEALLEAAMKYDNVFAGTDTAPHFNDQKYCECGAAGCFNAAHAFEHYAMAFHGSGDARWASKLEAFTSERGAKAYGLPLNTGKLQLEERTAEIDRELVAQESGRRITHFRGGETVPFFARLLR